MLAETVKFAGEEGGLGNLILMSQRRNIPAHIYLIILIVPIIALVIDRFLFFVQRQLFPHRFGGAGYLKQLVKLLVDRWQDFKGLMVPSDSTVQQIVREQLEAIAVLGPNARPYERLHLTEADRRSWRP
jgi:hypothetical protein